VCLLNAKSILLNAILARVNGKSIGLKAIRIVNRRQICNIVKQRVALVWVRLLIVLIVLVGKITVAEPGAVRKHVC